MINKNKYIYFWYDRKKKKGWIIAMIIFQYVIKSKLNFIDKECFSQNYHGFKLIYKTPKTAMIWKQIKTSF